MKSARELSCVVSVDTNQVAAFLGKIFSFNASLKLYHWQNDTERQVFQPESLLDLRIALDHLIETGYALYGTLHIVIPETTVPKNILIRIDSMFCFINKMRLVMPEAFQPPIDEYLEALQDLKYKIRVLKQVV